MFAEHILPEFSPTDILLQQQAHPLGLLAATPLHMGLALPPVATPTPPPSSWAAAPPYGTQGAFAPPMEDDAPPPYSMEVGKAEDLFSEKVCLDHIPAIEEFQDKEPKFCQWLSSVLQPAINCPALELDEDQEPPRCVSFRVSSSSLSFSSHTHLENTCPCLESFTLDAAMGQYSFARSRARALSLAVLSRCIAVPIASPPSPRILRRGCRARAASTTAPRTTQSALNRKLVRLRAGITAFFPVILFRYIISGWHTSMCTLLS